MRTVVRISVQGVFFMKIWDLQGQYQFLGSKVGLWSMWDALNQDFPGV